MRKKRPVFKFGLILGLILGAVAVVGFFTIAHKTSKDEYCASCHIHPHATSSWKLSPHKDNGSGVTVHCVDCHLPPKGEGYMWEKMKMGAKDAWSTLTKDSSEFNWEAMSTLEHAQTTVFKESCIECHQNMFPLSLSKKGEDAHLYYDQNSEDLHCINCHLSVGHYNPNAGKKVALIAKVDADKPLFRESTSVTDHKTFIENIPNSTTTFKMVAVPGGTFTMGSPDDESYRDITEGPVAEVTVSPFFMSEIEVSWNEYMTFYAQTGAEGRSTDTQGSRLDTEPDSLALTVDGISGATPPYEQPDQNWGLGERPAITISFHAAETYCKWLSVVTGKRYRLPTEAEWEYAAKAETTTPYFFEGDPNDYQEDRFMNKIFGVDTTNIDSYTIYSANSQGKTQEPNRVRANAFGLKNMLGNVSEFCSDWYSPNAYKKRGSVTDPKGPDSGEEHVIRGGSYNSEPKDIRSSARDFTKTDKWLKTDPQMPKSIWWLSDCTTVGIRVVCEYDEKTGK